MSRGAAAEGGKLVPAKDTAESEDAADPPSAEEIAAAKAAVDSQAAEVRMKDEDGLTNSDPEVQDAVAELLARKSVLAELEENVEA